MIDLTFESDPRTYFSRLARARASGQLSEMDYNAIIENYISISFPKKEPDALTLNPP